MQRCSYYTLCSVDLKEGFAPSRKSEERSAWFLHTLLAIMLPFPSSRTSILLRALKTLFGFTDLGRKRYYTFMASPKTKAPTGKEAGRPRKYGDRLGTTSTLASVNRGQARDDDQPARTSEDSSGF